MGKIWANMGKYGQKNADAGLGGIRAGRKSRTPGNPARVRRGKITDAGNSGACGDGRRADDGGIAADDG